MDHETVSDLSQEHTSSARVGVPARAIVSAGGIDTHYTRAGAGEPLVLLSDTYAEDTSHPVLAALVSNARVIAPYIPAHVLFAEWLRNFLDGLGLTDVKLVADEPMAARAVEFASGEPLRVRCVLLLIDGALVDQRSGETERRGQHFRAACNT